MNMLVIGGAALAALIASSANAQESVHWPAPATHAARAQMSYFPIGTALMLKTRTQVSTRDNKPGDRFYLEVAENLVYRGQVVVPAGALAVAEVARAQRNGHFGRKGKLEARLLYVQTPSGPVRLSGRANDEGVSGTAASVATMLLVNPLGFLIHGTSAQLAPDTVVTAYLAEDLRFARADTVADAAPLLADPRAVPARFEANSFSVNRPR